jgi:hypothetical protein
MRLEMSIWSDQKMDHFQAFEDAGVHIGMNRETSSVVWILRVIENLKIL